MEENMKLAMTIAAGLLAASSLAFAADNNAGKNENDMQRDQQTTGSVNTEGRTVSPAFREFCNTNPADSMCQGLGAETNP
jgi:hypothetical protein